MAALENSQGEKICPFNQVKKGSTIDKQFGVISTRLANELRPDGVYYVLMARSINEANRPDRYPITKGKVSPEVLAAEQDGKVTVVKAEEFRYPEHREALSFETAIAMNKEIAELKAKVSTLETENRDLRVQLAELEEDQEESLSEQKTQEHPLAFLKEAATSLIPAIDRYFDLEEKKLAIQEKKLKTPDPGANGFRRVKFVKKESATKEPPIPGSNEHLDLIEKLWLSEDPGAEDAYNDEMDRLQAANPQLYAKVLEKLESLAEEEEEEQQ